MRAKYFYVAVALIGAVFVYAMGLAWYGSRTATPAYIAESVGTLNAAQRQRFAEWINLTKTTLDPKKIGKPLSNSDVDEAVNYATKVAAKDEADASMVSAQDTALNLALDTSPAGSGGQTK
jgi:hypothetical protein